MNASPLDDAIRNIDARLAHVEQVLPGLATKDDLRELASVTELRETASQLATKTELREAVSQLATKAELREEGERTRHYFDIVAERLEGQIRQLAEFLAAHDERADRTFAELRSADSELDGRVTRLEARRRSR